MKQALLLFAASVALAGSPPSSQELLRRAAKSVEDFWQQLSSVNCVETVDQQKLGPKGKILYRQESVFDYLAVLQLTANDLIVEESREPLKTATRSSNVPLLVSNGFATFQLIFHPFYQGGFEYAAPEIVSIEGREFWQVRFRHVHGARSPSVLKLRQHNYPLEWQGTAWIEPKSAAIVRIRAALASNLEDLGLKALEADVRYAPLEFKENSSVHWLPSVATVEVETAHQHWRNVHSFGNYRLFSVDVKTELETPK